MSVDLIAPFLQNGSRSGELPDWCQDNPVRSDARTQKTVGVFEQGGTHHNNHLVRKGILPCTCSSLK